MVVHIEFSTNEVAGLIPRRVLERFGQIDQGSKVEDLSSHLVCGLPKTFIFGGSALQLDYWLELYKKRI